MPLDDDNEERKPPKGQYVIGADLEEHSVEALNGFVADLRREIERIEAAISKKGSGRETAESFFKKK
ncbi:DUF1192 domain-containing protein [Martelella lutilitoris]|uniref:DUF1192 domain-containing protein n=1 Tax=Martelella lutilitoris TaxID=2583532 RepID=A0A7T7HI28_9HYPH|nr:DUF1192 domain-containing protein [Martelella lutilitoris]QQM29532.1 DUF1192 domain-containing protein [Martelella lutilitoris]